MDQPAGGGGGVAVLDVSVSFADGTRALRDVDLHVSRGELVTVVGPSGSGKTTLLRVIAGLRQADQGRVVIGEQDVTHLEPYRRNVAMVFEADALVPFMDVASNLGFGLKTHRVPAAEVSERVSEEARHLRLTRLLPRKPATLSAGERGRVGVGKAVIRVPSVWLLDEPLAHLDPPERFELRRWLVREVRRLQVPTLHVTHDPTEAMALGDRVAVLEDGRLVQVDTPRGLYQRPANVFVADFAGPARVGVLPARLVSAAGQAGYQVGGRVLPCWAPVPPELAGHVGEPVLLLLRPEDVRHAVGVEDPDLATLRGTVVRTEFTGRDVAVTLEVDAPPATCPGVPGPDARAPRARLHARFDRTAGVQSGTEVMVAVDARRAHVCDPQTGAALWHAPEL